MGKGSHKPILYKVKAIRFISRFEKKGTFFELKVALFFIDPGDGFMVRTLEDIVIAKIAIETVWNEFCAHVIAFYLMAKKLQNL